MYKQIVQLSAIIFPVSLTATVSELWSTEAVTVTEAKLWPPTPVTRFYTTAIWSLASELSALRLFCIYRSILFKTEKSILNVSFITAFCHVTPCYLITLLPNCSGLFHGIILIFVWGTAENRKTPQPGFFFQTGRDECYNNPVGSRMNLLLNIYGLIVSVVQIWRKAVTRHRPLLHYRTSKKTFARNI